MRILHLTETAAAGVGRHVAELAEGQVLSGHEVHVIYSPLRIDSAFQKVVAANSQSLRVQLRALPIIKRPHWTDLRALYKLLQYLIENGPFDVVHGHSTKAGLIARVACLLSSNVCLYTPHAPQTMNSGHGRLVRRAYSTYETLFSYLTSAVVAVSEEEKEHLETLGVPGAKIAVVHNGIDTIANSGANSGVCAVKANLRQRWKIPQGSVCIGFLGRFAEQKDPDFLVRAFAALPESTRQKTTLVLAGNGPLLDNLKTSVERLNIAEQVRWIGGAEATPQVMSMFDVFALPSLYEGFPYVLLEAMLLSLPVVSSAVGGTRALIREGLNGFVLPSRDVSLFAKRLATLAESADLRAAQGQMSQQIASAFSTRSMVARTLSVYSNTLQRNNVVSQPGKPPIVVK